MKKLTKTTIKLFIVYVILMLTIFSCRTAKKEWVKENFTEKSQINEIKESLTYSNELVKEEIRKSLVLEFNKTLDETKSKLIETLDENTITKIDIEAEFGKIKEAMVGNTKVTSNGAKISVETSTNKSLSKDYESYKKESQESINLLLDETIKLSTKIELLAKENNTLKSELSQIKETQSKTVNKKQFTLGFMLLIVIFLIYTFRDKLKGLVFPFWNRLNKWF